MPEVLDIQVRGIYDDPADDDGIRVLVDRRWPRGVSKALAALDEWCSAVAPSDALRKWHDHVPERFEDLTLSLSRGAQRRPRAGVSLTTSAGHDGPRSGDSAHCDQERPDQPSCGPPPAPARLTTQPQVHS